MKVIAYEEFGFATEVLQVREIDLQKPQPREVIVKLIYSGVNPSDAKARAGNRPGIFKPEYGLVIPHSDGSGAPPVETNIELQFKELELITREKLALGY